MSCDFDVEINTNAIDVTSEAKEVTVTFRARDNFGVNTTTEGQNAGMRIYMSADGTSLPSSGQYESVTCSPQILAMTVSVIYRIHWNGYQEII